jgi:two-component system, NarL family, nitrate/nitrite response regulator NarL
MNEEAVMKVYDMYKQAMMPSPVRIAVVDDHPMFREGVIQTLKRVDGFEIVGEGMTADDAVRIARETAPDVVLLDTCLSGGGVEMVASIAEDCPNVRTIVLTFSECEQDVTCALRAGARGYVLKGGADSEIVGAVHAVVRGDFYFTPNFAARLLIERSRRTAPVVNGNLPEVHLSREVSLCDGTAGDLDVLH